MGDILFYLKTVISRDGCDFPGKGLLDCIF